MHFSEPLLQSSAPARKQEAEVLLELPLILSCFCLLICKINTEFFVLYVLSFELALPFCSSCCFTDIYHSVNLSMSDCKNQSGVKTSLKKKKMWDMGGCREEQGEAMWASVQGVVHHGGAPWHLGGWILWWEPVFKDSLNSLIWFPCQKTLPLNCVVVSYGNVGRRSAPDIAKTPYYSVQFSVPMDYNMFWLVFWRYFVELVQFYLFCKLPVFLQTLVSLVVY